MCTKVCSRLNRKQGLPVVVWNQKEKFCFSKLLSEAGGWLRWQRAYCPGIGTRVCLPSTHMVETGMAVCACGLSAGRRETERFLGACGLASVAESVSLSERLCLTK